MRLNIALALALLVGGCHASQPQTPEETGTMPYGKWGFAFFTPHAPPAVVTYAAIIDSGNVVSKFRALDSTQADPNVVGTWRDNTNSGSIYFNKVRHPPVSMVFCWDSIIDKTTYETQIIFKSSLRETMLTPTGTDRYGKTAWYKTLLFGLAPEGKVKIWLQDSAGGKNTLLEPKRIATLSGDKLDICKGITQHPNGYVYYGETPEFIKGKTYPYGNW